MPPSATLCPFCRGLNSAGERRCYRCGRVLPGPLASGVVGLARRALGGEAPVTRLLLGLCLAVFALCFAVDRRLPLGLSDSFSVSTAVRFGAIVSDLATFQPWRYLAAVFVHFSVLHLAMNGWTLSAIARGAEREFGSARFAVLFVVSGMLGFVVSNVWYGGMSPPTAGASGAIFGVFGALVGLAYARRDPNWKQGLLQNLIWLVILSLVGSVNNAAHAGGLVSGTLLGYAFSKESPRLKLDRPLAGLAALLLVLSLLSVVLCAVWPNFQVVRAQEMHIVD